MTPKLKNIILKVLYIIQPSFPFRRRFRKRDDKREIVFVLPSAKQSSGGVIVANQHSEVISRKKYKNYTSSILYSRNPKHTPKNFITSAQHKRDTYLDVNKDFVILPEIMACHYALRLISIGQPYGIHVQNGYSIGNEVLTRNATMIECNNAYLNAELIICNSKDTSENVQTIFPELSDKILRSYFVINKSRSQPVEHKKNIITYMPRKLGKHSELVLFFLKNKLPQHWSVQPIDGVSEQEVYDIFFDSKIFLSFSEFEGLAMPPAMAAMCGNKVIGYTGEANKEYFHLPCFEEVKCGDIKDFVNKIIAAVERFDCGKETLSHESIDYLSDLFSERRQHDFIDELLFRIDSVFSKNNVT